MFAKTKNGMKFVAKVALSLLVIWCALLTISIILLAAH